jgi:hypothetical protein
MNAQRADVAFWGACGAAAATSLALELPYLGDRAMHRDEALDLMVARRPLGELLETVQLVRGGAPLHFVLTAILAHLGGGLVATRLLSAICLAVAVVGVGLFGRALFAALEGAAAAWIVAICPVALFYGEFARMYALFLALSSLALWCLVRALDDGSPRYWAGLAAFLVVDVYAHPYGVIVGGVAGVTVLAALLWRGDRQAWRHPLVTAGCILLATAPLAIGYLVLASRLGGVKTPGEAPLDTPPAHDTLYQAFANFLGAPRAHGVGGWGVYLLACAALGLAGLAYAALADPLRGVLLALLLVVPAIVLAVVDVPGADNHVRYVIETLPVVVLLVLHGAAGLGRLAGRRGALAAVLVAAVGIVAVEAGRGRDLSAYLYRGAQTAAARAQSARTEAYVRSTFASDDLFFGYDPAWGEAVIHPGRNAALAHARGIARSEGPLIVRGLDRLHGPIAHGWYVALLPRAPRFSGAQPGCLQRRSPSHRFAQFQAALGEGFDARHIGGWAIVRTRAPALTKRAFARAAQRVFRASAACLGDPQAPTTETAVTAALETLRN